MDWILFIGIGFYVIAAWWFWELVVGFLAERLR
jgi:hypothetical protein